ncbi:MAG: polyphosphate polymerase domain-containing protein [Lachnospiraceae bacterium]|nr:polyphosphate polymerase domain-containing protein [Lachnospiraceae bacterium]
MDGYRKELKFIVGDDVLLDVRNRIKALLRPDPHQKGDHYRIRSIYFDSPSFVCCRENTAGVSPREKYRIRTYDCGRDTIVSEIKIRHRDTISKMNALITEEVFYGLISGDIIRASRILSGLIDSGEYRNEREKRVLEKYLARITADLYSPACIIDYERSAYIYDIANVRITIDRNITASDSFERMFDPALTGRPVLDGNMHVLEIKYDEFLPGEISSVLSGMGLTRSSSSKYAMGLQRIKGVFA